MKTPFQPDGGIARFTALLLVAAAAVTAAQGEAWAGAVQSAAAVYATIVGSQNREN
jgi:hypothetical protein